jgi:hypothetical protein
VSGGKVYFAKDSKMSSGKMMSEAIFGPNLGAGSQR